MCLYNADALICAWLWLIPEEVCLISTEPDAPLLWIDWMLVWLLMAKCLLLYSLGSIASSIVWSAFYNGVWLTDALICVWLWLIPDVVWRECRRWSYRLCAVCFPYVRIILCCSCVSWCGGLRVASSRSCDEDFWFELMQCSNWHVLFLVFLSCLSSVVYLCLVCMCHRWCCSFCRD